VFVSLVGVAVYIFEGCSSTSYRFLAIFSYGTIPNFFHTVNHIWFIDCTDTCVGYRLEGLLGPLIDTHILSFVKTR